MNHSHQFPKISERYNAYVLNLTDDSPGGLIEKLRGVFPETMPDNEIVVHQWLPPRTDPVSGKPIEVCRLRIFRVPVSKDGPTVSSVARVLDELDAPPAKVRMPDAVEIPPEVQAMKDNGDPETMAARIGISLPKGSDLKTKKLLLAREIATSARAMAILEQMRDSKVAVSGV